MYVIVDVFCIYVTKYRAVQNGVLLYSVRKPVCEGRAVWGTYHCDFVKREEGNTCYRAEHLYLLFLIRQHRYNLSVVLSTSWIAFVNSMFQTCGLEFIYTLYYFFSVFRIRIRSDPYHLVGSGSVSGNVDMDPGSAKN